MKDTFLCILGILVVVGFLAGAQYGEAGYLCITGIAFFWLADIILAGAGGNVDLLLSIKDRAKRNLEYLVVGGIVMLPSAVFLTSAVSLPDKGYGWAMIGIELLRIVSYAHFLAVLLGLPVLVITRLCFMVVDIRKGPLDDLLFVRIIKRCTKEGRSEARFKRALPIIILPS